MYLKGNKPVLLTLEDKKKLYNSTLLFFYIKLVNRLSVLLYKKFKGITV